MSSNAMGSINDLDVVENGLSRLFSFGLLMKA